jgi:hypothetical protein
VLGVERAVRKGGAVWRVRLRDEQSRERSRVIGRKRGEEVMTLVRKRSRFRVRSAES